MDVLTDLLQRSHARGAAFSRSTVHGRWGVRFPGGAPLAVHAILEGTVHAWVDDPADAVELSAGEIVLLQAGPHHMAHTPGGICRPWSELLAAAGDAPVVIGATADGPGAAFFCGAYLFDGDLSAPLLAALPPVLRLRPEPGSALRAAMDLLAAETSAMSPGGPGADPPAGSGPAPGRQALLDRLLDVVLVGCLRQHLIDAATTAPGWFRAAADPDLGSAMTALHADPARPWTVAELARAAHLSRTAFARRFTAVVGVAPLTYLAQWRMAVAKERLRDTDDGLAAIASEVGYSSPFAFAAAFKRHTGLAPGRWRADRSA